MEITPKTEAIIKIFCIVVLIAVNVAIYENGKTLSCDKCTIKFTSAQRSGAIVQYTDFNVSIMDLYREYENGYCSVSYGGDRGFIEGRLPIPNGSK